MFVCFKKLLLRPFEPRVGQELESGFGDFGVDQLVVNPNDLTAFVPVTDQGLLEPKIQFF